MYSMDKEPHIKYSSPEYNRWQSLEDVKFAPETLSEANPSSVAKNIVEQTTKKFDSRLQKNNELVNQTKARISQLEKSLSDNNGDERIIKIITQQITDTKRTLRIREAEVEFARIPNAEDVDRRINLQDWFPEQVKESIPDDLPLVFHGSSNLGQIKEILRSNGLSTPEQRGESMASFAVQIDVGAKTNINTPCKFAESNHYWMPYGAIFAFMPKPEEIEKVNNTGESTEVFGGVDGVNFKTEPERLYGIITTSENIDRFQKWCEEYGLDKDKVLTHEAFIELMKDKD